MTLQTFLSVKVCAADVTAVVIFVGQFVIMEGSPILKGDVTEPAVYLGIILSNLYIFSSHFDEYLIVDIVYEDGKSIVDRDIVDARHMEFRSGKKDQMKRKDVITTTSYVPYGLAN